MKKLTCCVSDPSKVKVPMDPSKITNAVPEVAGLPSIPDLPDIAELPIPKLPNILDIPLADLPIPILSELNLKPLTDTLNKSRRLVNNFLKSLSLDRNFISECWPLSTKSLICCWIIAVLILWLIQVYMIPLLFLLILCKNFILIRCPNVTNWIKEKLGDFCKTKNQSDDEEESCESVEDTGRTLMSAIITPLIALQGFLTNVQRAVEFILKTSDDFIRLISWEDPELTGQVMGGFLVFTVLLIFFSPRLILILTVTSLFIRILSQRHSVTMEDAADYLSHILSKQNKAPEVKTISSKKEVSKEEAKSSEKTKLD